MTASKTYGFARKAELPKAEGNAKVCNRCDLWFLAAPRERVCTACLRPSERAARAVAAAAKQPLPEHREYPPIACGPGVLPAITLELATDWMHDQFDKGLETYNEEKGRWGG